MNRQYLVKLLTELQFPEDAVISLGNAYEKLISKGQEDGLLCIVEKYDRQVLSYNECIEQVKILAIQTDIHEYVLTMIYLIFLGKVLKRQYTELGIDEKLWVNAMADLRFKASDCHGLYGIWGTKDAPWHKSFFSLSRFGFGKLQFDSGFFGSDYEKEGLVLCKETPILNVHIPRTGEKLDYESVQQAYRDAIRFFRWFMPDKYEEHPIVFVLKSWMLFEKHKEILDPASNFMRFCSDFEIIERGQYADYANVRWVFNRFYDGDLSVLPKESSLQRAYIEMIKNQERNGWGRGIYCPELRMRS